MDGRQAVFLLGGKNPRHPSLLSYQPFLHELVHYGEFLEADHHLEWLSCYDRDSQPLHTRLPLCVFRPYTVESIAPFIKVCRREKIPVAVRGGGSGLTGGSVTPPGGILMLTSHLKAILQRNVETGEALIEAGVTPRQLNQAFMNTGWTLPLEMSSSGICGLGGALNMRARGYHQSISVGHYVRSVHLVDGQGETLELPAALIEGSEGLFGVTIRLLVQLEPCPSSRIVYQLTSYGWEEIEAQKEKWQSLYALRALIWNGENEFTWILEGERWRVAAAQHVLKNLFPEIHPIDERWMPNWNPVNSFYLSLSHAAARHQLPALVKLARRLSEENSLQCRLLCHVLEGTLNLQIFSSEELYPFLKQLETFMVLWIAALEAHQGFLVGQHGVGALLKPYMTPFYREEELYALRKLTSLFDPAHLFEKDRFFPIEGKSLEKVSHA